MKVIDCKQLATNVNDSVREQVSLCKRAPHLLVITVGQDPASEIYVRNRFVDSGLFDAKCTRGL